MPLSTLLVLGSLGGTPALISWAPPLYPAIVIAARVQGTVPVAVVVAPSGCVEVVDALGGPPLLWEPSESAAAQWLFAPSVDGVAVVLLFSYFIEPIGASGANSLAELGVGADWWTVVRADPIDTATSDPVVSEVVYENDTESGSNTPMQRTGSAGR